MGEEKKYSIYVPPSNNITSVEFFLQTIHGDADFLASHKDPPPEDWLDYDVGSSNSRDVLDYVKYDIEKEGELSGYYTLLVKGF